MNESKKRPYAKHFNYRIGGIAYVEKIDGKPESEVERVFGPADEIKDFQSYRTYYYRPYWFLSVSQVEVFCERGRVTGVKLFDD